MNDKADDDLSRRLMAEVPVERTWHVPPHEGYGPVTMTLRIPEVRITDSAGRFILVSPRQSEVLGSRLENISDWLQRGAADWFPEGEEGA